MEYFDSHAHLDDTRFDGDRAKIMAALPQCGVTRVMNVGCDAASSEASVALAEQYPFVYAAVGSHPDDAAQVDDALLARYRTLARSKKVRAIGEIGLDYYYEDVPRPIQQQAFTTQLALAQELGLPVIVHERDAHGDAMQIVRQFPQVHGVFHCYSGATEMAQELVSLGWYLGFTGVVTFKNAKRAVEVVKNLPLERILIETDCPYMAPEPYRGRRNDSRLVPYMARKIAEIKGLSEQAVAAATTENAMRLFSVPAK